jgi:heme exporter protein A
MRLIVENLACVRGGRTLFHGLAFTLSAGEALRIVGPNGAGKTTLLRLIAGLGLRKRRVASKGGGWNGRGRAPRRPSRRDQAR